MTAEDTRRVMSLETALLRVGWVLERYAGCDSQVLRVLSAADLDAVAVLADHIHARASGG